MGFYVAVLLGFSVFLPGLMAVYRFDKINRAYFPFLLLVWVASINELTSFLLLMNRFPNFINNNLYALIESILIVFLFRNLNVLTDKRLRNCILAILLLIWLIENITFRHIHGVGMYFRTVSSLIIVLASIAMLNISLIDTRHNIFKNPDFLICACFIVYFTLRIMVEMFWLYGFKTSDRFQLLVYDLINYVNVICNLIFMFAVLWMPRKQVFTMR